MSFFKISTSEENVRDYNGNGGNFLNKSGMYEIIIKNVIADVSPNGSQRINLFIEYNGQDQMIFNAMTLTKNDGTPASVGTAMFNKMAIVLGADENTEIEDPVQMELPIGKGGEMKMCSVLEQFNDSPIIIRLQMQYSLYDGKIQERKVIRNFFRVTDKATASEIVNNVDTKGSQYHTEEEYADKTDYQDNLTEEDIANWIKNGRTSVKEDTKPTFGKRTFGKK